MIKKTKMSKDEMISMLLSGLSYQDIANKAGISRQRVQQITSPPSNVRITITIKYNWKCADCGIYVGNKGQVHHENDNSSLFEDYNDIDNLVLLCLSCHRKRHTTCFDTKHKDTTKAQNKNEKIIDDDLLKTVKTMSRHTGYSIESIYKWIKSGKKF